MALARKIHKAEKDKVEEEPTSENTISEDNSNPLMKFEYYLMADFYQILGVSRDADADTLRSAYRKLARQYHLVLIKNQVPKINLKK